MQNGRDYVNISVRRLYVVHFYVKQITTATTSHQYSLQERVFLLSAYYHYSTKYKLIFNVYQKRFLYSTISRCEMVYHIVNHFEKTGSVDER